MEETKQPSEDTSRTFSLTLLACMLAVSLLITASVAFIVKNGIEERASSGKLEVAAGNARSASDITPDRVATPTVRVVGLDSNGDSVCGGSGTIVETNGTVITSAQVVTSSVECSFTSLGVEVATSVDSPPVLAYEAELLTSDVSSDIAVIRVVRNVNDGSEVSGLFMAAALGDSDNVDVDDQLQIVGYPVKGDGLLVTRPGKVSGFVDSQGVPDGSLLEVSVEPIDGASGGTVLDSTNQVVGIVGFSSDDDSPCLIQSDTSNTQPAVTEADGCVDTGASTVVRPINSAMTFLEKADEADPVSVQAAPASNDVSELQFSNPRFALGQQDNKPAEVVVTPQAGVSELCLFVDWEGMPDGVMWDLIWYLDGEPRLDYSLRDEVWGSPTAGQDFWACAKNEDGLSAGLYEAGFFVENEPVFAEGIRVNDSPVAVHEVTWKNDVSPRQDICGLAVNPFGSGPVGLNELDDGQIIKPGKSVVMSVPAGTIVAAAEGCDGERVAAELDGLEVDGPKSFSIGVAR